MNRRVRVRFAPSPTGGLHLGGVRTALYNYLFARANGGDFVLRIEDTDQNRFVAGAEEYIVDCLRWCGLEPDESPQHGGLFAPYRQSERKSMYRDYAEQLVAAGDAYYAFDTPADLEEMRRKFHAADNTNPQYDHRTRGLMMNSLTLSAEKVAELISNGTPYVIRIKMAEGTTVSLTDMIRGEVHFDCSLVDDKVLLKADGMPTYHLAVVVDDYLMQITHVFRGEEWLPSAPVHVLLWEKLGWKSHLPQWAHLPLILKPDGNGKLSKRDGDRLGFPVFAMNWTDPKTGETTKGFRELGFLPEAFVNMLAMLGWNDGTGKEILSLDELVARFGMDRVHKGGAKFDYEKAKWYNHQHIQHTDVGALARLAYPYVAEQCGVVDMDRLQTVVPLIRERCALLSDFAAQGHFFFVDPEITEKTAITEKWNEKKQKFFEQWVAWLDTVSDWTHDPLEAGFNELLSVHSLKKGDVLLPLRVMLVGGKYGPGVFQIAEIIGAEAVKRRVQVVLRWF